MLCDATSYLKGYDNGQRLQAYQTALDSVLAQVDHDGWELFSSDVRHRAASYLIGFSDGWHGIGQEPGAITEIP